MALNKALLEEPEIRALHGYEAALDKAGLKEEEVRIKEMAKACVDAKAHDPESYDALKADYDKAYAAFMNHPLVVNAMGVREEANSLLQSYESIINRELSVDVDSGKQII